MKTLYACAFCAAIAATAQAAVEYSYEGADSKTYVANVTAADTAISADAVAVLDANEITNFVVRGSNVLVVDKTSSYAGDVRMEAAVRVTTQNALGVGPGKIYVTPKKKIIVNGGMIAKSIHFDSGTDGWNSDTGISMWQGNSELKGLVTFSDRNFAVNPYVNSFLVFSGGLQGPGYPYLREGAGGTLIFTNVAVNLSRVISVLDGAKPSSSPYALHLVFAVAGNTLAGIGNANTQNNRFTYCKLSTTVDWAFDNTSQQMNFGAGSLWDLCGTSQRVGYLNANRLNKSSVEGPMSVITNSSETAAALYITQTADSTPKVVFAGRLSVGFAGNKTTTIDHAMTAEGEITVAAGRLSFAAGGSWKGARKVSVANGATVSIADGDAFGEDTEIALNGSGSLSIAAGEGGTVVTQTVGFLTIDGSAQERGLHAMGDGVLNVLYSGRREIVDSTLELAEGESFVLDDSIMCDSFDRIRLGATASLDLRTDRFFSENAAFSLSLGAGSTINLADGVCLYATNATYGGAAVAPGRHTSADTAWLTGGGTIYVPFGTIAGTDVSWTGEGVDTLMTTEGNWANAVNLSDGGTRAVFATGGSAATVTGSLFLNGLSFNTSGTFAVDASGEGAELRLASGGLTTAGSGKYTISAPLVVDGDQTWDIGHAATINGGIHSDPLSRYTVRKTGSAQLTVSGTGDFSGDVQIERSSIVAKGTDPLGAAGKISLLGNGQLVLAGATISKPITINAGEKNYGQNSGFAVWGDYSPSEIKGKVTLAGTLSSFNVYIYSNGSNRGKVTFSGGIEGASDYPHLYPNGGGSTGTGYSTLVITNRPFVFGSDRYLSLHSQSVNVNGISYEMILAVPGNVCMAFGHPSYRAEYSKLYTTVDGVFANEAMSIYCGNNFTWDLCGTVQNIGTINSVHTSGNPPTVTNSSETAATLAISQTATADSKVVFGGKLNVSFAVGSGKTLTISDAMTAEGTLSVSGGTLALAAGGSWRGATEVAVSGGGKLTVAEPRALGKQAALELESSASLEIASGVTVRVDSLTVGGVAWANGSYPFGSGTLAVGKKGMVVSFR